MRIETRTRLMASEALVTKFTQHQPSYLQYSYRLVLTVMPETSQNVSKLVRVNRASIPNNRAWLSYGNATAWSKMFAWAVNSRKPVSITVSKISTPRKAGMNGNVTHSTGGNEDLLCAASAATPVIAALLTFWRPTMETVQFIPAIRGRRTSWFKKTSG